MHVRGPTSALAPLALLAALSPQLLGEPGRAQDLRWQPLPATAAPATPPSQPRQWQPLQWQPLPEPQPLRWSAVPAQAVITPEMVAASAPPEPPELPEPEAPTQPVLRNLARGITVNGEAYPDTGLKVPNAFAADPHYTVSTAMVATSRTRSCDVSGDRDWKDCADLEAYIDLIPFRWENASLGFQWTVQSLSGRNEGTPQFAAQSLGFRTAINLGPTTGLAFGGEHVLQLDDNTDLGRNFYLVLSQAIPLNQRPDPWLLVGTAGIGSDFYGYGNNGILGSTDCLSGNNISSRNFPSGTDCYWGPIGSLSLQMGPQVAVGLEWFGFGIGAGVSVRPIPDVPFTMSFYLTDFLGNVPSGIEELCTTDPCEPRLYARFSMSF
ncbi:hypothetical protein KBY96_12090 [Cyanobium sp. ATX 6A2]|uniref:hypothetical protein n=1 Tax=Cyanobium sp. ATX 6A2 TaxID=2823700 RepID=UPI0020CB7D74|nr:hypothetical protein [Cyanobium sp. ATX 6A2]MCP9888662.1 hypothetical protein [Cyanobium sp. ATX 6A2]